jgi:acyl carrier protein
MPAARSHQSTPRLTPEALLAADPDTRPQLLASYLSEQAARVLGLSSSKFNQQQSLGLYGLDSLMAVELRNRIETDLKIGIPIVEFLRGPSIRELSAQTMERLTEATSQPKTEKVVEEDSRNRTEKLLANLDQLSNEQMDSLLTDLLINEEE